MRRRPAAWAVVIPLAFILAACGDDANPKAGTGARTADALGRAVLDALKKGDVDGVMAHFVDTADAKWVVGRAEEAGVGSPRRTKNLIKAASDDMRQDARDDWRKILTRAVDDGVVWTDATFEEVLVEGDELVPGVTGGRAHLIFRSGANRYQIRMGEVCLKTERGWVLFPEARWYGALDG